MTDLCDDYHNMNLRLNNKKTLHINRLTINDFARFFNTCFLFFRFNSTIQICDFHLIFSGSVAYLSNFLSALIIKNSRGK